MKFPKRKSGDALLKRLNLSGGFSPDGINAENGLKKGENVYVENGVITVRPSLKMRSLTATEKTPTAFYTVDNVTAVLTADDAAKIDFFDKNGGFKKTMAGTQSVPNSLVLLDNAEARLMYVKDFELKTDIIDIDRADDNAIHEFDMASHAYVPTVAVGGTGFLYEDDSDPIHFDFNGKLYEDKNIISNSYIVRQTAESYKNVYTLPYIIEDDTTVSTQYRDDQYNIYNHGFQTGANGALIHDTVIDDVDELRVQPFSDCRNAIAFKKMGTAHSKIDSPVGCLKPNDFTIKISERSTSLDPAKCTECAVFDYKNVKTWIIFGHPYYKNTLFMTGYGNKCYFPESGKAAIGPRTEAITAIKQVGDQAAVLKENSLWLISIETGDRYTEDELMTNKLRSIGKTLSTELVKVSDVGCDCPKTAANCDGRLIWLNSDGKIRMLTDVKNPTDRQVCELSYLVENSLKNYSADELKNAMATYFDGKYYLVIGNDLFLLNCRANAVDNYASYADDLTAQKKLVWHKWSIGVEGVNWRYITAGDKPILYGDVNGGYVCCAFEGDDGVDCADGETEVPVSWSAETSLYDLEREDVLKRAARLEANVTAENEVTAAVVTENGCDGCAKIAKGETPTRVTVKGAEKSAFIGAKFKGSGKAKISDITLSAVATTHKT